MGSETGASPARPLVSVVIPHYDRPVLLRRALESVARQSYDRVEVIVVDDASPTDPSDAVRGFGLALDVRVLRMERNGGPSAARNVGVQAARGDYIAFLDSDDEWLPEKLAVQVAAAEASGRPDDVFCISQTFIQREDDQDVRALWSPASETLGEYFFLNRGIMQTSSFLVARPLAQRIGFEPSLRQFEDILFVIQAAEAGCRFVFQPQCLFHWYRDDRQDQLSRAISLDSGFRFLDLARGTLDRRERLAFVTRFLGPALAKRRPFFFARQALAAMRHGVLTPRSLAGVVVRSRRARTA